MVDEVHPNRRTCGAVDDHRRLLIEDPGYAAARSQIETLARAYEEGARMPERIGTTRIPVVVHVVWNTATQNLSQAQIESQIDVLNQDFRRANPDTGQVPQVWQSDTGDARVEFFLATTDPNGNPATGITRTQTQRTSFSQPQNDIKSAATGGVDPWPADRFLNVWVGPDIRSSQGQSLLGYAQFPGGPAATDGVVILHSAFGTTGTAAAPFDRGRTATHEIGHWLNLFHIWGDDGTGCNGTDEVADTPNQGGPNFGCPAFPRISCNNGPNGDMFMNYMDYTDDACMFMFTAGQVARMQATLDGPRSSIGSQVSSWSDWASLGGVLFSDPVVNSNADGRLEVFIRGTDNRLYHKWQTAPNNGWVSDWGSLDGVLDGNIAVGRNADGRLEVFVRGTNNALYNRWQTAPNNGWSADWGSLGGVLDGNIAVGQNADGRLEVFVRGTDNALYHRWQTAPNNGWSNWSSLGGVLVGNVAVGRNADGRLEVFVRGTNNALYHRWQTAPNNGWSDWSSLGGVIFSDPVVAGNADGRLEVFVRGTDNALYHRWQTAPNDGWSDWVSLGGVLNGNVTVGRNADGRLEVFVRGTDNSLYHKWQT